ncbi:major capsid hexamer protein [Mycobacterium phage KlimbOn]|uniref:Major capsid hexamer protein n=13 Tax=Pegunavirus TaxID=1623295 RepID=L7TGU3_9CAUD|nr:major head protein [Mycobacterium phage Newman]YP_009005659.1 major head protein [Mycobacterium phage Suffolk]AEJ95198.1 major capsid hexamer protein [Mycobacterium phage KLucky39]AEK07184.1 major capsid hexamer protein [Mycobacterium phage Oosterbaan]AEK10402.1 major capsid hexamer protein [Mycobacterium phage Yoshand]AER49124.1 major capsid hexamer protein [Mycobacterium phage ThreeOh3D2]AGC33972.1 major capsid hexamer protein [Mycobacterium phage Nacho]AGC34076.1 major capsid hexamer p
MYKRPEQLPGTAAELDALLDAARADINVITARHKAGESLTPEDAQRLKDLLSEVDELNGEKAKIAVTDELPDLLAKADAATAPADDKTADEPEGDDDGDAEGDDDGEPEGEPEGGEGAEQREPAEAITASTGAQRPQRRSPNFAGAGANDTPGDGDGGGDEPTPRWKLHPGAPGYREGMGTVGFADISQALEKIRPGSRAAIRPNRPSRNLDGQEFARQVVSTLDREVDVVGDSHALVAAITKATDQRNLPGGSLIAAGGWCAPSEQLYDFCDVPEATDLISLPEITINRGGIRWPREPDLSGIFEEFEWFFTEPELEATDPDTGKPTAVKTCVEIPCADEFDEIRLNAVGWCVEAGILQEQGWPELVEWFMRSLTQEHFRALSRRTILNMVAGSTGVTIPATSTMGAMASVLNSLALVATNIRLKRGLSRTATIEGVAPSWFHEVIRADLAMRAGGVEVFNVSDAQIQQALAARNIALQYVGDWQTRESGKPGNLATVDWPDTVDVLLYPAGTWFRSMSNVIELGVMYPKEQLQYNRFTRMFTEDAIAVGKRCGESVKVTLTLDVSGATGLPQRRTNLAA